MYLFRSTYVVACSTGHNQDNEGGYEAITEITEVRPKVSCLEDESPQMYGAWRRSASCSVAPLY